MSAMALENMTKDMDMVRNFLCETLGAFITGQASLDIPDGLNWDRLEKVASANVIITILESILPAKELPEKVRRKWRDVSIAVYLQYTRSLKATVRVQNTLEKGGVPSVALRGMALTQWVYSDPVMRPMADVDILVPTFSQDKILDLLDEQGLVPVKRLRSQYVYNINGVTMEIHWSLLTPRRYREALDTDEWVMSRNRVTTDEGDIYCLSPENELIDLVCHAFIHHELDTLLKLVDIAMLMGSRSLNWDYLKEFCEKASMTRLFSFTLALADYLFDVGLSPRASVFGSDLPNNAEKVFEAYASRMFDSELPVHYLGRKKNLVYVAERPVVKLKQLLRFLSADEISGFFRCIF